MKKILPFLLFLLPLIASSQSTAYYKGEWSVPSKQDHFTCVCRVLYGQNGNTDIEIIWTFKAIDSSDEVMMNLYRNKKDLSGIEYTSGRYDKETNDLDVTGYELDDPHAIIAKAKYYLKLSPDKSLLYGPTADLEDRTNGLFAAVKVSMTEGQFDALRKKVKGQ